MSKKNEKNGGTSEASPDASEVVDATEESKAAIQQPKALEVTAINRTQSPINGLIGGRHLCRGYTLLPGVMTKIPREHWDILMVNKAFAGMVDEKKILAVEPAFASFEFGAPDKEVSTPQLPEILGGKEKKIGSNSGIKPPEIKSEYELAVTGGAG